MTVVLCCLLTVVFCDRWQGRRSGGGVLLLTGDLEKANRWKHIGWRRGRAGEWCWVGHAGLDSGVGLRTARRSSGEVDLIVLVCPIRSAGLYLVWLSCCMGGFRWIRWVGLIR